MSKHYYDNYTHNYISGNVYAVTGAGSGFGQELAIELVKMGGKVVINGRRMEKLEKTIEKIKELGKGDCIAAIAGDVSKFEDNVALVNLAVERFGKLDAFVANAGTMPLATFPHYKEALDAWEQCIDINMKGNMFGMCASYEQFAKQGYGHFVTVSSIHANFPTDGAGIYAATKIGIRYMAQALRNECHGLVKVSIISPTGVGATGLMSTVVNPDGASGIFGTNIARFAQQKAEAASGEHPEYLDNDDVRYLSLSPEELVWGIMFALNQPKGVNIGDISVRSTNEPYIT